MDTYNKEEKTEQLQAELTFLRRRILTVRGNDQVVKLIRKQIRSLEAQLRRLTKPVPLSAILPAVMSDICRRGTNKE